MQTYADRRQYMRICGKDSHPEADQSCLKQKLSSQPSEETNPANSFILDLAFKIRVFSLQIFNDQQF